MLIFDLPPPKDALGRNYTKFPAMGHLGDLTDSDNILANRFTGFDFVPDLVEFCHFALT